MPTLDDVLDWYSVAREQGVSLEIWQKEYPSFASDLARFDAFLKLYDLKDACLCDVCDGVGKLMVWGRYCYGTMTCIQCNGAGYVKQKENA